MDRCPVPADPRLHDLALVLPEILDSEIE